MTSDDYLNGPAMCYIMNLRKKYKILIQQKLIFEKRYLGM